MIREGNSISDTLWELGVTHERDAGSNSDQCHMLYYAGRSIGRYDAHMVANLLREHGLEHGCALCTNHPTAAKE